MATKICSYSEIDCYRQCRLKHQLAYKEMWAPDKIAPALSRGTLFHSVMEAHYGKIMQVRAERTLLGGRVPDPTHEDLFLAVAPLLYEEQTGSQTDEQALVEWIYRGYVDLYQLDPNWEIIQIEQRLEEWLPTEKGTRSTFKLAGTTDLLVRDHSMGGGLWIVDHKTCRNLPKQKDFDMEDQTGIYAFLLKRAGLDIRGAIYNFCRTEKLKREMDHKERFKRHITVRTDKELERMALEALDLMREAYGRKKGDAPRSPDGERCGWKCGFTEPCLAGRKGGDMRTFLRDTGHTQQDHKPGPSFNPENIAKFKATKK